MDHSNQKCFTEKETREMHRFFFEKEDQNPFTVSFEEPSLEMIIEELIKSSLPLKRRTKKSSAMLERELNNPYKVQSNKRARLADTKYNQAHRGEISSDL